MKDATVVRLESFSEMSYWGGDTIGFSRVVLEFLPISVDSTLHSQTTGFSRVVLEIQPTSIDSTLLSQTTGFKPCGA